MTKITLQGMILPTFRGGTTGQVAQMRLQAGLSIPLPLISGLGNYLGQWVINSISTRRKFFGRMVTTSEL